MWFTSFKGGTIFDEFLPLPLIVKSTSDSILPGSGMNLMFIDFVYFLLCAALFGIFMLRVGLNRKLAVLLPTTVYFIAILFAEQSQNAGMRFQAPLLVATLLFSTIFFSSLHSILCDNLKSFRRTSTLFFSALILLLMPIGMNNAKSTGALIKFVTNPYYINFLPYNLASKVDEDATIALTEAGKLAYWMPGKKYDLIGLNTARTAISGASVQYIEELSPDLIMAHHAGLLGNLTCPNGMDFCVLARDELENAEVTILDTGTRVRQASAATIEFLLEHYNQYTVVSVRYGPTNKHIYGIRKNGLIDVSDFMAALQKSHQSDYQLSYSEMKSDLIN